jgi:hypothetical protein
MGASATSLARRQQQQQQQWPVMAEGAAAPTYDNAVASRPRSAFSGGHHQPGSPLRSIAAAAEAAPPLYEEDDHFVLPLQPLQPQQPQPQEQSDSPSLTLGAVARRSSEGSGCSIKKKEDDNSKKKEDGSSSK